MFAGRDGNTVGKNNKNDPALAGYMLVVGLLFPRRLLRALASKA